MQGTYRNYRVFFSRKPPLQLIDILYSADTIVLYYFVRIHYNSPFTVQITILTCIIYFTIN